MKVVKGKERNEVIDKVLNSLLEVSDETAVRLLYGQKCSLIEHSDVFNDVVLRGDTDFFTGNSLAELDAEGFEEEVKLLCEEADIEDTFVSAKATIGGTIFNWDTEYNSSDFDRILVNILKKKGNEEVLSNEEYDSIVGVISDFRKAIKGMVDKHGSFYQSVRFYDYVYDADDSKLSNLPPIIKAIMAKLNRSNKLQTEIVAPEYIDVAIEVTPVEWSHDVGGMQEICKHNLKVEFTVYIHSLECDVKEFAKIYAMSPKFYTEEN